MRYSFSSLPGKLRLMSSVNRADMGNDAAALGEPLATANFPDIALTRVVRTNYGFAANLEQAIIKRSWGFRACKLEPRRQ